MQSAKSKTDCVKHWQHSRGDFPILKKAGKKGKEEREETGKGNVGDQTNNSVSQNKMKNETSF